MLRCTEASGMYGAIGAVAVRNRRFFLTLLHVLQAASANYLAFLIRFDGIPPHLDLKIFTTYLPLLLGIRLCLYIQAGLNKCMWSYVGISDLANILRSATTGTAVFFVAVRYLAEDVRYPLSIYILDWLLFIGLSGGFGLLFRMVKERALHKTSSRKVLIVGAGDAGEMLLRSVRNNSHGSSKAIGFIDDDPYKKGSTIHGVPIFGPRRMIPEVIRKYKPDEILISISQNGEKPLREIYELCKPYNIRIKKLPTLDDILQSNIACVEKLGERLIAAKLVTEAQVEEALVLQRNEGGRVGGKLMKLGHITEQKLAAFFIDDQGLSQMKPISLEDLLQREQVRTDIESVKNYVGGKSVLVTGAGGSIGSELCRQILNYNPSALILLDRNENGLFYIDLELRASKSTTKVVPFIGDIQDADRVDELFLKHNPQIVFHAAAYKHVPLMESSLIEAVKNNIFGTKNLIDTASRYGVESFVMISTDKAVNPTSTMGATKRVAEFLSVSKNAYSKTGYKTVRFGNVLGSNGSVVPTFTEQLKRGGPLTVTHPEIKRFFMLIPEAVQLVLIAASSGNGGEIFVLDMGEPIRILDLAENFIRLAGFVPHEEVKIVFTGLRPGEKLYEELFDHSEEKIPTFNKSLSIAIPQVPELSKLEEHIARLQSLVLARDVEEISCEIKKLVPNFNHAHMSPCQERYKEGVLFG